MQNNTVELMVKVTTSKYEFDKDGNPRTDCVAGESCQLGMSRLLYELPLGEDVLFTERPEQSLYVGDDCKVGYFANNIKIIRILKLGVRRGPSPEARALYEDLSPPSILNKEDYKFQVVIGKRETGSGRPTKNQRRATDKLIAKDEQWQ